MLPFFISYADVSIAERYQQLGLEDPAIPVMEGIINFHNHLMVFLVAIAGFVGWLLFIVLTEYHRKNKNRWYQFTHATLLEIVWAIVPALILLIIAIPSLGIKVDAIPCRLSQASVFVKRLGVFYGQCSDICGTNYGFMPSLVRSIDKDDFFISWVSVKMFKIKK